VSTEWLEQQLYLTAGQANEMQRRGFHGSDFLELRWQSLKLRAEIERRKSTPAS